MWQSLAEVGLRDIVDMGIVGLGLYGVIVWLRQAKAGLAVVGLLGVGVVYFVARQYRLELTAWMLQSFFAVFVIILVVMLQADLRRLFERAARWHLRRRACSPANAAIETLAQSLCMLADQRRGALIVLPGLDPVERYIDGGTTLNGQLSRPLLLSLFDPCSPGHDGAVVVQEKLVRCFGAHLPLSDHLDDLRDSGTRHSAALGLAEMTDALVLVVSEERGEIAVAHRGRLRTIDRTPSAVEAEIRTLRPAASPTSKRGLAALRHHWADAAFATVLALTLWTVLVSGTQVSTKVVRTPVLLNDVRRGYELDHIEPGEVDVVLTGLRRDLYLIDPTTITLRLDGSEIGPSGGVLRLSSEQVRRPDDVSVREIRPGEVQVRIRPAPPVPPASPPGTVPD